MNLDRFKFRAWLDAINEMVYSDEYEAVWHFFSDTYPLSNSDALMQCVGHKDLDGRDIYEGDIVEEETTKETYTIVYSGIGFWYQDNEGDNWVLSPSIYKLKVIGNIYQNKELINGNLTLSE